MITKSLKIGDMVYDLCKDICSGGCFPIIADKGAKYPFMIYRRSGLSEMASKDHNIIDFVNVEIIVCSTDYTESVNLITKVKDTLELKRWSNGEFRVIDTDITGGSEYWNNDAYVQSLNVMFKVC